MDRVLRWTGANTLRLGVVVVPKDGIIEYWRVIKLNKDVELLATVAVDGIHRMTLELKDVEFFCESYLEVQEGSRVEVTLVPVRGQGLGEVRVKAILTPSPPPTPPGWLDWLKSWWK